MVARRQATLRGHRWSWVVEKKVLRFGKEKKNGHRWRTRAHLAGSPHPSCGITITIQLPNLGDQNYELRHGLINMIERIQFHGLSLEDPVVYIGKFLRLTNTVKSPANAPHYIILVVFPFSLEGKTDDWLGDFAKQEHYHLGPVLISIPDEVFPSDKV
ncbi:hypothetical protein GmHk_17G050001 [Glycine max]|nr:hypothetical protein GmHk_17G050001 [Glycine max]